MLANYPIQTYTARPNYVFAPNNQTVRPLGVSGRIGDNFELPVLGANYNFGFGDSGISQIQLPLSAETFPIDLELLNPVSGVIGDLEYSFRTKVKELGILIFALVLLLVGLYGAVRK